jgi:hypothetical protein
VSIRIEQQIEALLDALQLSEQEEKKRYNAAIDIEDMAEATAVTIDARTKIQQLRKWTEDVLSIQKEIQNLYFSTDIPDGVVSPTPSPKEPVNNEKPYIEDAPSDDTSSFNASEYVRQKLHQLSKTEFLFSEEQLSNIQDYMWCRNNLRLPHPLARIYDDGKDILEQTAISGAPRRYWVKERFRFGDVTLLIYSGWASLYIPYFDKWYQSLIDENARDNSIIYDEAKVRTDLKSDEVPEEIKVGRYIRDKLRALSHTDFTPSDEDIAHWQDKSWSKRTLNLNYEFVRIYSDTRPMGIQIVADNGANRYWAEVFEVGSIKLLFCSQWYRQDREFFDRWYDSLAISTKPAEKESGITVPNSPVEFSLFGTVYSWHNWDDVLVKLCEEMILKNPYKILGIGVKKFVTVNGFPVLWYNERDEQEQTYKLSNGLSLMKNIASNEIITCFERILDLCGFNRNELKIR